MVLVNFRGCVFVAFRKLESSPPCCSSNGSSAILAFLVARCRHPVGIERSIILLCLLANLGESSQDGCAPRSVNSLGSRAAHFGYALVNLAP